MYKKIGYFNRTGRKFRGHYNTWLSDEIVELAGSLDIEPSFPTPTMLATRITTSESFGIIPVPRSLVAKYGMRAVNRMPIVGTPHYRGQPAHLLSHFATAPTSPYTYLQERQKTQFAVLPIHTHSEFALFTECMHSGKFLTQSNSKKADASGHVVDFESLARWWNDEVHKRPEVTERQSRIFYKLPEQLERHYKTWSQYRAEKATVTSHSRQLQDLAQLLTDEARAVDVPAALPLPNIRGMCYTS